MDTLAVQRALATHGFDPGPLDGIAGARTAAAVMAFQRASGLVPDGIAGRRTMLALGTGTAPALRRQTLSTIGRAALIAREGRALQAYRDSVGVWTIGIGHTAGAGPPVPRAGLTISAQDCDALFARDVAAYEDAVGAALRVPLADHQFDALVSVCYNIGPAALAGATFTKRINARAAAGQIRDAILMWRKPAAILGRRTAEADQFETPYGRRLPKARAGDAAPIVPASS